MKVVRTHDEFYLKENRKHNTKEYFKFIYNKSKEYIDEVKKPRILDIGCATGDFLYFLSNNISNCELTGMDVMDELLAKAKDEVKECNFIKSNIYTGENLPSKKFDYIYMSGVHSIFDDYKPWIDNLLKLKSDAGRIYVFGIFNPEKIDVIIKSRGYEENGPWQTGWNLFSKYGIEEYLNSKGFKCSFTEFKIGIDIDKNENDPLRSWTFKDEFGDRQVINGLQLLHKFYLMEII